MKIDELRRYIVEVIDEMQANGTLTLEESVEISVRPKTKVI